MLSHSDILELRRWNTPTIYNGWEAVTKRERLDCALSWEEITDFTPHVGPMVGYAVTVEYICSDKKTKQDNPDCFRNFYHYLAEIPGPKVLFAKDLDAPKSVGSIFGEVTGNAYRALNCVGAITDGFIRDVDEAAYGGFKMLAKRLGVGHAYSCPLRFGTDVEMYGSVIKPGMFVHADKYGFIAIPPEETKHLVQAVRHMDRSECKSSIPAARESIGKSLPDIAEALARGMQEQGRLGAEFIKSLGD